MMDTLPIASQKVQMLECEIAELRKRLQPHDTGHINTAISVLEARVQELKSGKDDPYLLGV
jgi:hypothetical protein